MTEFTTNLRMYLPDFNISPWHDEIHDNFRIIDAAFQSALGLTGVKGIWKNSTAYTIGMKLFDDSGELWVVEVNHTSAASPTTFAEDRAANPTFWSLTTGTDSAILDALAALNPDDGDIIVFTDPVTAALLSTTVLTQSLLGVSDPATFRSIIEAQKESETLNDIKDFVPSLNTFIMSTATEWTQVSAAAARTGLGLDAVQDTFDIFVETVANKDYVFKLRTAFAGTIILTSSDCTGGTCTATFKINGVALGGTANAVSTTEDNQNHASANAFVVGDTISVTISANAACLNMQLAAQYVRKIP